MSTVIDSLVSAINNAVKANGNKEITGIILQVVLDNMVGTLTQINGLLNVNQVNSKSTAYASASDARQTVPDNLKTEGLVIAYKLSSGWIIEQNKDISGTWTADSSWQTVGPVSVSQNTNTGHKELKIGNVVVPTTFDGTFSTVEEANLLIKKGIYKGIGDSYNFTVLLVRNVDSNIYQVRYSIGQHGRSIIQYRKSTDNGTTWDDWADYIKYEENQQSGLSDIILDEIKHYTSIYTRQQGIIDQSRAVSLGSYNFEQGSMTSYGTLEDTSKTLRMIVRIPLLKHSVIKFTPGTKIDKIAIRVFPLVGGNEYHNSGWLTTEQSYEITDRIEEQIIPGSELIQILCKNSANIDITPEDFDASIAVYSRDIDCIGKIYFVKPNDGQLLSIDNNMNFVWPSTGGALMVNNRMHTSPNPKTVSLIGFNSTVLNVLYNINTHQLLVKTYTDLVEYNQVVLATIRVDQANTPTRVVNISSPLPFKGDEPQKDEMIYPYMRVFKSIPNTEIATEFQSMCKVGNEIWIATGGSGQAGAGTLAGYIHRYDLNWEYIGSIEQNGFHFNSISYDEVTDRLITGEAGDGSKDVYIFNNISNWPTIHASTPITSADIERTITISQIDNRPNPVWAERNAYGHRDMIISANLNGRFLKIKLGYGTNQLTYGVYTASSANVPNGTYDVIWNYSFDVPQVIKSIGSLLPYSNTVCQDIEYYKGKIYVMTSATPTTIMELTPVDGGLEFRGIHQLWCDDSGVVVSNCANEGIFCLNGKLYCGVSAIGVDTTITDYNNKILCFDI